MQLDPEISRILGHSRIEKELLYVWKSFREKTGPKLKNKFMRYVQLANQAARLNGELIYDLPTYFKILIHSSYVVSV